MKHFQDIKNKLEWEKYYDPNFNWDQWQFYAQNILTLEFLEQFEEYINWNHLSAHGWWMNQKILDSFKQKVNWNLISLNYPKFSEKFLIKFQQYLDKQVLSYRAFTDAHINFPGVSQKLLNEYLKK